MTPSSVKPTGSETFLRFVVSRIDEDSSNRQGVFAPAYELFKGGALAPDEQERLGLTLEWFQAHLPLPDRSRIRPEAIFWFKAGADDLVRHIWRLVEILIEHDHHLDILRTSKPGYIVYQDTVQVCAVPFNDTPR
ncbi:hypothetical protein [Paludisphaera soli]|uniref:hypothetical protein n=1 Tax=Paludisphaera soli TaxID=2712865 RepID=UPI0013EADF12|nr:hypothetical protein [Paludisphaera soli]